MVGLWGGGGWAQPEWTDTLCHHLLTFKLDVTLIPLSLKFNSNYSSKCNLLQFLGNSS